MRIKKRVLSGGVVVLTVFLVLGVCKPDIDKFCRQNRSITAFFASKGVDSFGEYLGGFMFDAAALGVCAVLVFLGVDDPACIEIGRASCRERV